MRTTLGVVVLLMTPACEIVSEYPAGPLTICAEQKAIALPLLESAVTPADSVPSPDESGLTYGESPSVITADIDGDGQVDIVVATALRADITESVSTANRPGRITVLFGPAFLSSNSFRIATRPRSIAAASLHRPQSNEAPPKGLDIAIAFFDTNQIGFLTKLNSEMNPAGQMSPTVERHRTPSGGKPSSIAVGYLNNDRAPDLITADQNVKGAASMLLQDSGGGFEPDGQTPASPPTSMSVSTASEGTPNGVALGNIDGGALGAVVANSGQDARTVSVVHNSGGTQFADQDFETGKRQIAVAVADLDGRKLDDIVLVNRAEADGSNPDTVSVLLNDGDGTFGAAREYPTGSNPQALVVADMNLDHLPDLVVANHDDDTVGVLLNNGSGEFIRYAGFAVEKNGKPKALALRYTDSGKAPDVVVTYDLLPEVTVLDGSCFANLPR